MQDESPASPGSDPNARLDEFERVLDLAANAPTYVYAGFKVPEGTDTVDIALGGRSVTMAGIKVPK